ncbi:Clp protease ClpP [Halalkalibacterium halodurans]|uniref:head maturation protease, ClpP-related n=1 Tax=Halalkalibacterium halodurans TaxID=86665 RepID=UPI002E1F64F4|nr:head maturation protease, ClpP-related [Halalkalibacterium halodurans]MED4124023.1 Clp protease ClpP [Halalkalibacterium halodurans]
MKNKGKNTVPFLSVKNLTSESADLYIYGEIVDNTDWKWDETDVMPDDVKSVLDQLDSLKTLNIYINSPGGSVFAGLAIYNMLKRNTAQKKAYIDGVGASMASIIPFAADQVFIPSNAFLMIHKPLLWTVGNATDLRKAAEDLDVIESGMIDIYKANLAEGIEIDEIQRMMEAETWLTGTEAAKYFNVEVIEAKQVAALSTHVFKKYNKTPSSLIESPEANDQQDLIKLQNELDLLSL